MRAGCRAFLDRVGVHEGTLDDTDRQRYLFQDPQFRMYDYFFGLALGELRATLGMPGSHRRRCLLGQPYFVI